MTQEEANLLGLLFGVLVGGLVGRVLAKKYRPEAFEAVDTVSKIALAMGCICVILFLVVVLSRSLT